MKRASLLCAFAVLLCAAPSCVRPGRRRRSARQPVKLGQRAARLRASRSSRAATASRSRRPATSPATRRASTSARSSPRRAARCPTDWQVELTAPDVRARGRQRRLQRRTHRPRRPAPAAAGCPGTTSRTGRSSGCRSSSWASSPSRSSGCCGSCRAPSRRRSSPPRPGRCAGRTWPGVEESKDELREVVEFLRDPKRFRKLGARVPRGILLHGPPGTGKTLLAKAVAHESNATFFAQSASSFVEMFAGLGAARIRRLFRQARKETPGDHLHRRARRRRRHARQGHLGREGPDAQPAAGRARRLRRPRRDRRDRRLQPARQARPGAAAPGPLRPPDLRLAARPQGPPRDPRRAHARQAAGREGRPRHRRPPDQRPDRRRPGQPLQRGRDLRRAATTATSCSRATSRPRSSA